MTDKKYHGHVKWFNDQRGFGFISVDDGPYAGKDVFVHFTAIITENVFRSLKENQLVTFEIMEPDVTFTGGFRKYAQCINVIGENQYR